MEAFYNSLSDDGVLVMQLGESPEVWNADETHSKYRNRASTMELLEQVGFESIHAYEEVSKIRSGIISTNLCESLLMKLPVDRDTVASREHGCSLQHSSFTLREGDFMRMQQRLIWQSRRVA